MTCRTADAAEPEADHGRGVRDDMQEAKEERPKLLESEDVAELLGVKVTTARRLMRDGDIPGAVKVGRRLYVPSAKFYGHLGIED